MVQFIVIRNGDKDSGIMGLVKNVMYVFKVCLKCIMYKFDILYGDSYYLLKKQLFIVFHSDIVLIM